MTACLVMATAARASDLPPPYVVNFPVQANQATPAWLGHPVTPASTFAAVNLPIQAPDSSASLLVTVYFQEKQGGFLRITWQGTQGAQVLSQNFYEGIGMGNQRGLLITPDMLAGDGTLGFQCGDTALGIQRIKLEWLESKTEVVSPLISDSLVTSSQGTTVPAQQLNGQAAEPEDGAWQGKLVTVPVTDQPLRIEQGVEFSVQLDQVPASGRLSLKESGLGLGRHLVVWINQQRAGVITPEVPTLADDGYLSDSGTLSSYLGWRDGSFYVPVSLLKAGVNTLQFSAEDETASATSTDGTTTEPPLAVKEVELQLGYPPDEDAVPATNPAPVTASAPPASDTAPSPPSAPTLPANSTNSP